jgi:hypothetical protein
MGMPWNTEVASALVGLGAGAGAATIKYALDQRARLHEDLWTRRLTAYRAAWALTSQFSRWPRQKPTVMACRTVHEAFRRWYYGDGGMLMSSHARKRYEFVQQSIGAVIAARPDGAPVDDDDYADLTEIMSGFRSALTGDIESRRRHSIVWQVADQRRDVRARAELQRRVTRLQERTRTDQAVPPGSEPPGLGAARSPAG